MMYSNNFVVVVKHRGKVLRESENGIVRLPFGSDYTILLKNKDSRKAVADVEIDGEQVAAGVIVPGNKSVELKGALNGLEVRNHFRFIEKTREISNHRGDRADDGLVRVEYRFEKYTSEPQYTITFSDSPCKRKGPGAFDNDTCYWTHSVYDTAGLPGTVKCSYSCDSINTAGITVKGAETKQDFVYGYVKPLEKQSHVIVLQLKGVVRKKRVKRAVTVKTRIQCSTCGRKSRSHVKFCNNCGTYLR
jgi:hypothetical protein